MPHLTTSTLRRGSVAIPLLVLLAAGIVIAIRSRGTESLSPAEVRAIGTSLIEHGPRPGNAHALALGAWITGFGQADHVVRAMSTAITISALLPLGWIALRRSPVAALVAVALVATAWPFMAIAADAQSMGLAMALATLSMAVLVWARSGPRWRLLIAVAVAAIGVVAEPAVALIVPAQATWMLLDGPVGQRRRTGVRILTWSTLLTGAGIGLVGLALTIQPGLMAEPTSIDRGLALVGPGRAGAIWLAVAGLGVLVASLRRLRASSDDDPDPDASFAILSFAWATVPLLVGSALAVTMATGGGDAVAIALPGIALILGHTAERGSWKGGWPAAVTIAVSAVLLFVAVAPNGPLRTATRTDWRAVASVLAAEGTRWDRFLDPGEGPMSVIEHYARLRGIADELPQAIDPSDPAITDPRGPFRLWALSTHPALAAAPAGFLPSVSRGTAAAPLRLAERATVDAAVAVYGATASGVQAAISAARTGADVVLVATTLDVGGMVTNGLGHTDIGDKTTVGGQTLEFYVRVGQAYEMGRYGNFVAWDHEPSVARRVFEAMLDEAGVRVITAAPMDRTVGPTMVGSRIASFATTNGTRVAASAFVDATYEGDLLAAAGVPYLVGREPTTTYGESLAGVRPGDPPEYKRQVYGRRFDGGDPLPGVVATPPAPAGSGDGLTQAYTFRLCVTDVPSNRIAFPMPEGYRRGDFSLIGRAIDTWTRRAGAPPPLDAMVTVAPLPNGKGDLNSAGPYSTDMVGGSTKWAEASDAERAWIWEAHRRWVAGYLYFLRSDPSVPSELRAAIGVWGLCADEFRTTEHWPAQLYVREARRMIADVVLTQSDVVTGRLQSEPVAIGSYRLDSHYVQRVLDADGFVIGEGLILGQVRPYQIPMDVMIPATGSVDNLAVSVAVSASHVAWSSLRMEPTFMMLGEAAGLMAAEHAASGVAIRDIPYEHIGSTLRRRGAVLELH